MTYNPIRRGLCAGAMALAVALTAPFAATAQDLMERTIGDGLRVAFFNFRPYAYEDKNGVLTGTDVDTLRAVLKRMGGSIKSAGAVDWGALIPGVKANRFDVVAAGMFITPARCAEVHFSEPTFGIAQTLIVLAGNPHGVSNYESVAKLGLTMAAVSGSAQVGHAKAAGVPKKNIMQIPDNPTAVAALRADRAQVYALSVPGARSLVAGLPEQDLEMTDVFSEVAGKPATPHGAFAFRPKDAAFVKKFNKVLTEFIGSPEHLAIFTRHGMAADELPRSSMAELCRN